MFFHCIFIRSQNQCDHAQRQLRLQCDHLPQTVPYVPSAALLRELANAAVVLVVVLGSRTVEMSATQSLIIHGLREHWLAKVGRRDIECHRYYRGWILCCGKVGHAEDGFCDVLLC